ncbi:hypothetical protein [Piscinibacter sp.]|uniref:hypothetical protein n=1 Tax=Piscinibacter sp. TaxID=1903157 RepID=UPI002CD1AA90|nr:hypothetical protein [Albitalea sp.]HUG21365.1 hypothetical protein [Albitalea sp.]
MVENAFAIVMVAICGVFIVREMIGERRRDRLDTAAQRIWHACRRTARRIYGWRSQRKNAADTAEEAIRRARTKVERDGNVIRPESFRGPRDPQDPRNLH